MKKLISLVVFVMILISCFSSFCFADPLTVAGLSATTFAMQSYYGISFSAIDATGTGMQNWMTGEIQRYVNSHGGDLGTLFGLEQARLIAGKLVVAQNLANGIAAFTNWLAREYNLSSEAISILSEGFSGNVPVDTDISYDETQSIPQYGFYATFSGLQSHGFITAAIYVDGRQIDTKSSGYNLYFNGVWHIGPSESDPNTIFMYLHRVGANGSARTPLGVAMGTISTYPVTNKLGWQAGQDYGGPDVLNPNEHWEGEIDGWTGPDTNIGDLFDDILEGVADTSLSVEGEVIEDIIPPQPTPIPIDPDTPLYDVPWEGLDDLIGDQTEVLDGIADTVGDIAGTQEGIAEGIDEIEDTIEEVIAEGIDEIEDTIEEVTEVVGTDEAAQYKFDLRTLFPFCIPFDFARMLAAFDGAAAAPHISIPISIPSLHFQYTLTLDFSPYNGVAATLRQVEFIAFAVALAVLTSKMIRW